MKTKTPNPVGHPYAEIKYPRGAFTINELHALNKENVKAQLTIWKHVKTHVADNFLTKLDDTVHTGKRGKPATKYIRTAVWKAMDIARKSRGFVVDAVVETVETNNTTDEVSNSVVI